MIGSTVKFKDELFKEGNYYDGKFYVESEIPSDYIEHGSLTMKDRTGVVKHIYKEFYLISFKTKTGHTTVGFLDNTFDVIKPGEQNFIFEL